MGSALASQAQLSPLWRSYDTATGSPLSGSATAIASRAQQLSPFRCLSGSAAIAFQVFRLSSYSPLRLSYRLPGSATAIASTAQQLSPLGLSIASRAHQLSLPGSSAMPSRAQQLSPLKLSSYLAAIASQAQQRSPLGLSSDRLSGSSAIASRAQQLSPLGLSSYRPSGSSAFASRAQQLSPFGLSSFRPSGSAAAAPPAHQLLHLGLGTTVATRDRRLAFTRAQRLIGAAQQPLSCLAARHS